MTTTSLQTQLQAALDQKTKPIAALGALERLALTVGMIQHSTHPNVNRPMAFIFAADHGVCEEGVNPFPQAVTEQMLANFSNGGAAMNVFCRTNSIALRIINMGIVNREARWSNVDHFAIDQGTQNFRTQSAMTREQCQQAMTVGEQLANQAVEAGHNCLLIGEMGIGNTTSASAILAALLNLDPALAVGPGTGASEEQLRLKQAVISDALKRVPDQSSAERVLMEVGGFEIAAMVGVLLSARALRVPVIVDGFICSAAALVAAHMNPIAQSAWIFAHQSAEPAHQRMLAALNAEPLLDLGLRLGEGTGAALAYPIVKNAVAMLNEMATFTSAGISK